MLVSKTSVDIRIFRLANTRFNSRSSLQMKNSTGDSKVGVVLDRSIML